MFCCIRNVVSCDFSLLVFILFQFKESHNFYGDLVLNRRMKARQKEKESSENDVHVPFYHGELKRAKQEGSNGRVTVL